MPQVTLYNIQVSAFMGKVKITEDTFEAEDRDKIYLSIKDPSKKANTRKIFRKDMESKVTLTPLNSNQPASVTAVGFYVDANERTNMMIACLNLIEKTIVGYRNEIQTTLWKIRFEKNRVSPIEDSGETTN